MKQALSLLLPCMFLLCIAMSPPPSFTTNKEVSLNELTQLYHDYYLGSNVDSMLWDGSIRNCNPGKIPKDVFVKAQNRINFFRLVNRLPIITVNPDSSVYPQAASLMMLANKKLDHYPQTNWKCYSLNGIKGAKQSCLGFTDYKYYPGTAFITGFIKDQGDENYFVGHRCWILYSQMQSFAYGATGKTESLYSIFDFCKTPPDLNFTAYPWNGYVPHHLIFEKWSFSIPESNKVSFAKVKLSIKDNENNPVPFTLFPVKEDFLDHTLVWKMTSMFAKDDEPYGRNTLGQKGFIGKEITVRVENVLVNGISRNYEYKVKIVKLQS